MWNFFFRLIEKMAIFGSFECCNRDRSLLLVFAVGANECGDCADTTGDVITSHTTVFTREVWFLNWVIALYRIFSSLYIFNAWWRNKDCFGLKQQQQQQPPPLQQIAKMKKDLKYVQKFIFLVVFFLHMLRGACAMCMHLSKVISTQIRTRFVTNHLIR